MARVTDRGWLAGEAVHEEVAAGRMMIPATTRYDAGCERIPTAARLLQEVSA